MEKCVQILNGLHGLIVEGLRFRLLFLVIHFNFFQEKLPACCIQILYLKYSNICTFYNNYIKKIIRILIWIYTVLKQVCLHIKIRGTYGFVCFFFGIKSALILSAVGEKTIHLILDLIKSEHAV